MERQRMSMGGPTFRRRVAGAPVESRQERVPNVSAGSSLIIGAKTLAGIGIGLLAVTGGVLVIGALSEAVLVPSLLMKLAGGLTGGGIGMAKGLKDTRGNTEE